MHIDDDESIHRDLGQLGQLLTDEQDRAVQLLLEELVVLRDAALLQQSRLDVTGPDDLRRIEDDLTSVADDPLVSLLGCVVFETLFEDGTDRLDHLPLYVAHPELDVSVFGVYALHKVDLLALDGHHRHHAIVISELEISDSLEHLPQVTSHTAHFLGLG